MRKPSNSLCSQRQCNTFEMYLCRCIWINHWTDHWIQWNTGAGRTTTSTLLWKLKACADEECAIVSPFAVYWVLPPFRFNYSVACPYTASHRLDSMWQQLLSSSQYFFHSSDSTEKSLPDATHCRQYCTKTRFQFNGIFIRLLYGKLYCCGCRGIVADPLRKCKSEIFLSPRIQFYRHPIHSQ